MSDPQPIRFSVPEAEFDLALLPEAVRQRGSDAFREAVTTYFKDAYLEAGGRVDVGFAGGNIEVNWEPQSGQVPASATITAHLEAGRYEEAIPLLRTRLQLEPDHVESLYNLGMVCSDRMELTEARQLLSRAVELDPSHVNAQVALGIAALRARDTAAARAPLEKAVVLEPRNPFARRTLGQLLLMEDETAAALPHLRAAAEVADDAIRSTCSPTPRPCSPKKVPPTKRKPMPCSSGRCGWRRWGRWRSRSRANSASWPPGYSAPMPRPCRAWMRSST